MTVAYGFLADWPLRGGETLLVVVARVVVLLAEFVVSVALEEEEAPVAVVIGR